MLDSWGILVGWQGCHLSVNDTTDILRQILESYDWTRKTRKQCSDQITLSHVLAGYAQDANPFIIIWIRLILIY